MGVQTILPIKGVPDELIMVLNARFRQLGGGGSAINADGSTAGHYFTHSARRDANSTTVGTMGYETDRGVVYQVQTVKSSQVWVYTSGTMADVAASRPVDLGSNDEGFLFLATDTLEISRWDGSAWVAISNAGGEVQIAYASGSLALTGSLQDVAGATLTLNKAGTYLITATFWFQGSGAGDVGQTLYGQLSADGSMQVPTASLTVAANPSGATCSMQWTYSPATSGKVVKLRGFKSAGSGSSTIAPTHTCITALWVSA